MKNCLFLFGFILLGWSGQAQEFSVAEGFEIGRRELKPSLSILAEEFSEGRFHLTEVNFNKEPKREINLLAIVEQKRYEKNNSYVELEGPMPDLSKREKTLIEVTNDFRLQDRSGNFDIYSGKKKIPAYEEMRVPRLGYPHFSGYRTRAYANPYYSPFLR